MGNQFSVEDDGQGEKRVIVPDYYWNEWVMHAEAGTDH